MIGRAENDPAADRLEFCEICGAAPDDCTCLECPVCKAQGDPACRTRCVADGTAAVLAQLDGLAEVWGDEGVFRRCRDGLREIVAFAKGGKPWSSP